MVEIAFRFRVWLYICQYIGQRAEILPPRANFWSPKWVGVRLVEDHFTVTTNDYTDSPDSRSVY